MAIPVPRLCWSPLSPPIVWQEWRYRSWGIGTAIGLIQLSTGEDPQRNRSPNLSSVRPIRSIFAISVPTPTIMVFSPPLLLPAPSHHRIFSIAAAMPILIDSPMRKCPMFNSRTEHNRGNRRSRFKTEAMPGMHLQPKSVANCAMDTSLASSTALSASAPPHGRGNRHPCAALSQVRQSVPPPLSVFARRR